MDDQTAESGAMINACEAALREILDVISQSRDDEQPGSRRSSRTPCRPCDARCAFVNRASRLCDEAEDREIPVSPCAATAIEDDFELADHGDMTPKGVQDAVPVQRVVGPRV